jgi:hypothetical protein
MPLCRASQLAHTAGTCELWMSRRSIVIVMVAANMVERRRDCHIAD